MATLLVIDANAGFREALAYCLPSFGHRVVAVEDVESARRAEAGDKVDLVLIDAGLGTGQGLASCLALRRDPKLGRLPILLLAWEVTPTLREQARLVGANGIAPKLFEWPDLLGVIDRLLGGPPRPGSQTGS
ncbi:MAG TPA: response regulator [Opitutus sp.]|nr:response regulator [Opitutus sp.]